MANYLIDGTLLTNIGNAIRGIKGGTTKYTPAEMASTIEGLTHTDFTSGSLSITSNGTKNVSQYASAVVDVPGHSRTITNGSTSTSSIKFTLDSSCEPIAFMYMYCTAFSSTTTPRIISMMGRRAGPGSEWYTYTVYIKGGNTTYSNSLGKITTTSNTLTVHTTSSATATFITSGTHRLVYAY